MLERARRTLPAALYGLLVHGIGWLAMAFLIAPIAIALLMSLTAGQTLRFPPQGLSLRWYAALFDPVRSATEQTAALNSLEIAALAVLGSVLIAAPAAIGITRLRRRRALVVEPLLLAPLVLPSLVYGLAALVVANAIGLRPSFWLTVTGHIVVFGPLMYRATAAIAQNLDPSLAEASATMGAGALTTLRRVILPLLVPGILAGGFLVFIESLDNVSVSLFLADPKTTVLPLRMFALIEESLDVRVAAMSGVLIAVTLAGLLLGRRVLTASRSQS